MLSTTDQQEQALHLLENVKHFFMSLFISSTGLIMSPRFLLQHLPVLAGGVLLTVVSKTVLVRVSRLPLHEAIHSYSNLADQ